MRVVFSGQVPKDPLYPEAMEDCFDIRISEGRIALSDGASESFDSKTWARILTSQFVDSPFISNAWINKCIEDYNDEFDRQSLSWSKQASFDRGSYATLLGMEVSFSREEIEVIAVGDSICAVIDSGNLVDVFPYDRHEQFQQRPKIFSTIDAHNSFVSKSDFYSTHFKIFSAPKNREIALLVMTDALGEWALRNHDAGEPLWSRLVSITEKSELDDPVFAERATNRMRVDDVTLLHIAPLGDNLDELSES